MDTKVVPWMVEIAQGQSYIFQQDRTPAHTAGTTQTVLAANVPDFWGKNVWPPNSPYFIPLDYFLLSTDVSKAPHSDLASLEPKFMKFWSIYTLKW